ncbi:MAG: molybdopterin synthase subunit MoaD / molybdopterin synthase subunit MoaE [Bryobacterales bacterium]|nr:molybdopterin synthase subunit MoaD / molybdopterin synthase subunit MoaE [Bryobacterales bacterium]
MFGEAGGEKVAIALAAHFIAEADHFGVGFFHDRSDQHLVVETGGAEVAAVRFHYDQEEAVLALHVAVSEAERAAEIDAGDFHPDQVIRVINDAHLVGFGVANTHTGLISLQPASIPGRLLDSGYRMRVTVLFFGSLKDVTGCAEETLELPEGSHLAGIFDHYAQRFPKLRTMAGSIVMARNQEFSPLASAVAEGDEVAFLPPVSGGADGRYHLEISDGDGHFFALTRYKIETRELTERMLAGSDGAVVAFEGVVRDNTKGRATRFLEYECYEPMAVKMMAAIGREIAESRQIGRIAMVHRLGRMEIGEASVAIVVTAPHRRPAFEGALEGIDRLKKLVPIWKKEHFADGEVWVEGEWDERVRNPPA